MEDFLHHQSELSEKGRTSFFNVDLVEPHAAFERIMRGIGTPIAYSNQKLAIDIKPRSEAKSDQYHGSYVAAPLHTDKSFNTVPPRYIGMMCISNDESGGESLLADGDLIVPKLSDATRKMLSEKDVFFPPPAHIKEPGLTEKVIATIDGTRQIIRFRLDLLLKQLNGSDPELETALKEFLEKGQEIQTLSSMIPGQVEIYDNHRMLHGRREITARPSQRHLLRMYANEL